MPTVPPSIAVRKCPKAFNAILDDDAGVLTQLEGQLYFLAHDTEALIAIQPEHCNFLVVLGEVGLSATQQIMDTLHGSLTRIACSRTN
jgi:hypothetical protein